MAAATTEDAGRGRFCQYRRANGELCKRKTSGASLCWQHSKGWRRKWHAFTRNQSLVFVGTSITRISALIAGGRLVSHWAREEWNPTFVYLVPSRELIDCERRAFRVSLWTRRSQKSAYSHQRQQKRQYPRE